MGRRSQLLLNDRKVKRGYRKLEEEALANTVWRTVEKAMDLS